MWLIIPLIYFLGWWQTGSLRQAFNGTIAWILGYAVSAGTILFLDVGGYSGIAATPDSPGAGLAILGGFLGMWGSNILWRRRGGDPERKPGKWERAIRVTLGMDKKKKKKKRPVMQAPPQQQAPPLQQPAGMMPVDAPYRPAQQNMTPPPPPQQQPVQPAPVQQHAPPQQQPPQQATQFQQSSGGLPPQQPAPVQQHAPPQQQPPQQVTQFQQSSGGLPPQQPAPPPPSGKKPAKRNSPTADKYAKATGRALGAMFRGSGSSKKKPKNPSGT